MSFVEVRLSQDEPVPLDAALRLDRAEVLALVGPSGSGKSTILRAIAGLGSVRTGQIAVGGTRWFSSDAGIFVPARRRRVGFVFQNYALFPHMTAAENVIAAMGHVAKGRRAARAAELLERVHMGGLEARRPSELSGGQQQRVAMARALARDPELLLLDEPFSAVDRSTRLRLYREVSVLCRELDTPVILVTHDLEEAALLASRMTVLHEGRTLQSGAPAEVMTRPATAEVARLVNVTNLFEGTLVRPAAGEERLDWRGLRLEVARVPEVPDGTRVDWVVPDGFVVLHRRDRPSRGERENPVPGRVEAVVKVGQLAHVTLRPTHAPELPINFSVPAHVAERNGLAPGVEAAVSLLAKGIHVIPRSPRP
ncbi:MAG: ABC transporter ATP-binding protein [Alphaproteobacteria bacterium]|nr:MAG: ABC transporter ATP-binding protein [Alphaproteobacteria bacterium]